MLIITSLAASALGLLCVLLSLKVVRIRKANKVSVGDGDNKELQIAIRSHANLLEYAPISLILLACLELNGAPLWLVAIMGIAVVVGRILHPVGMASDDAIRARILGMQLTLVSIIALSVFNVLMLLWHLFT